MQKRVIFICLILLALAACNNNGETEPTTESSVANVTNTPVPPTNTPPQVSTLPPAATIALTQGSPVPTRTAPPSITPKPSVTSNLMIPVTPPSDTPEPEAPTPSGPVFTLTYEDFNRRSNEESVTSSGDGFADDSIQVYFEDEQAILAFTVAIAGENTDVLADLEFLNQEGRIVIELANVRLADDPNTIYANAVLEGIQDAIQDALDTAMLANMGDDFGAGFRVVNFTPTEDGFIVETFVQE